ncbi:myeloid leukemia factor [Anopheles cruzii]|uniref:myeloid leukemia factor n=1 Tax=Anopheles cruzii TaxID=68878 RepID=UPI0022EC52EA|nr:myeloid leukemia factor [Anopheles cruzii]XP_052861799.1 myeloid leukemia factor [Anopheles cruzii]
MSLFGMMNDLEDDPIFGHHMRSMRQMNNMLNSLFSDPFGMLGGGGMESIGVGPAGFGMRHNALMPFMAPTMGMNRLLSPAGVPDMGPSYSSSSVISMTSGPGGPQVYQATSSTRTGPGGIKETRKTVQDSRTGTKKMAIGHHIGERAHIIEREHNMSTGTQEERQDFINLDDEEAEDFDREFQSKARSAMSLSSGRRTEQLALPSTQPAPSQRILSITEVTDDNTCERCGNPSDTAICQRCNHGNGSPNRIPQQQQQQQQHQSSKGSRSNRQQQQQQSAANYGSSNPVVTARRPIRSPASSPLSMSSAPIGGGSNHHHITTSVHPHPYNVSGRKSRSLKGPSSSTTPQHHYQ